MVWVVLGVAAWARVLEGVVVLSYIYHTTQRTSLRNNTAQSNPSRVHTGQGKVRENFISSRSGKSQGILKLVSEF